MSATATALFVFGGLAELTGIVLVGSPDLVPFARRTSAWLQPRAEKALNRLLRILGRPRSRTVSASAAISASAALSASAVVGVSDAASLEEKVAFLLRRDQDAQRIQNDHAVRLTAIERETPDRLDELRRTMEAHVAEALATAHRYLFPARLVGVVLVIVGLGCATAGNFA